MSLETYTGKIADLVVTNPTPTDPKSQGDDHLRGIKYTLQQTFPGFDGPLTASRVPFTPVGGIAANNVQAALQEVDTETQAGLATKVSKAGDTMTGGLTTTGLSVGTGSSGVSQQGTAITNQGTIELFGPSPFIDFKTTAVDNDYRILESGDKSALNFQAPGGSGFALLQNGIVSFGMGILGFSYGGTEASGWINFPAWLGGYQFRFGSAVVTTNAGGGGYISYATPFSSQLGTPIINYGDNGWIDNPIAPIQSQLGSGGFGFQALGGANITIRINYISIGR